VCDLLFVCDGPLVRLDRGLQSDEVVAHLVVLRIIGAPAPVAERDGDGKATALLHQLGTGGFQRFDGIDLVGHGGRTFPRRLCAGIAGEPDEEGTIRPSGPSVHLAFRRRTGMILDTNEHSPCQQRRL